MAVRTFTAPSAILSSVAAYPLRMASGNDGKSSPPRSKDAAKEATDSFDKKAKDPFGTSETGSKPGITYAHQDKLPTLPIPELSSSLKKYIESLKPLQSHKEARDTARATEEFLKSEGPELQEKLTQYAKNRSSYIEQFWYDSYLNFDNPVVLNLNPFFLLEDDPTPARNNQVTRAASLVVSALSFVRAVRKEELPPDTVRGQPLDMYQYSRMFGTARIPTDHGCQIGQDPDAKHIVVICHGQFYWFDVLDDNSDLIMTEKDLAINLQVIVDDAALTPIHEAARSALGVLSTENRKVWSGLRDVLQREEGSNNSDCLNIVDSSLFILCLDYTEPATTPDLCMNMLCGTSKVERGVQVGTCTNRWYDKLQIIVCKNGSAGINFEHTGVDGHTVLRFASDVYTDTILRFARTINGQAPSLWASSSPDPSKRDPDSFGDVQTTPHKLEWDMIPELSTALRFAETRLADLIQQNEFATLEFGHFGKNFITSMGFSPDAFVQMAFQAAYYGLYGRIECTYEPAMTKMYYHGRTEAIRSVTEESVDFVRTFWGENPPQNKVDALRKACEKHTKITKESAKAQGADRHLYALYCIWQRSLYGDPGVFSEGASTNGGDSIRSASPTVPSDINPDTHNPTDASHRSSSPTFSDGSLASPYSPSTSPQNSTPPSLFADSGWDKLNTTILSTSNCGNPSLRHFGFGPTSGDGFGLGYIIKDNSISVCASSKHRQTSRYIDALEAYFLEIRKLLRLTRRGNSAGKGQTRAREAEQEHGRPRLGKAKSRGRMVTGAQAAGVGTVGSATAGTTGSTGDIRDGKGILTPGTESMLESDDEGLGGYGFFDAGMLLNALKSNDARYEDARRNSEADGGRRKIGRRLVIAEY